MEHFSGISAKEKSLFRFGILSAVVLILIILYGQVNPEEQGREEKHAESLMQDMINEIAVFSKERGILIDSIADPGMTGLIGPEWTGLVTTIGQLEAKRTSIQPEFASLMVRLLREAGVRKGDTIALGSSGSFPGLLLASLSAASAMGLESKTVISLGSSSFGASRPELTILDIYQRLHIKGLIAHPPAGISLGGEDDNGGGWEDEIKLEMIDKIEGSGYHFINNQHFTDNVDERAALCGLNRKSVKVFINAGGAMANIGTSASILSLKPGLITEKLNVEPPKQGAMHRALDQGIPVIHLLYIKGLVREYGLKWDPVRNKY